MNLEKFLDASDKWDRKYCQEVAGAIWKYQPELAEKIIQRYLSRERRAEFNLTNTYARRIFRRELLLAGGDLELDLFQPGIVVMWASIAHRDWACCDQNLNFDYQAAKQKIRNAFLGKNFIGVIEPGYYPDEKWEDMSGQVGCLVSFHAHIVVWDTSKSKLQRHQRKISARFLPVAPDDRKKFPTLNHLKTLRDLLKVLRYSTKMPFEGYDKEIKGNSVNQSHADLQAIHHYRLFRFTRKHSLFDAWLAGGDGADILRDVRKAALKVARGTD